MRNVWAILLFLFLLASSVDGSVVLQVMEGQKYVVVAQSEVRPWRVRDMVCVFRFKENIACGTIVKVNERAARVKIRKHREVIQVDDTVMLMRPSREPASTAITSALEVSTRKRPTYDTVAGLNMTLDLIFPKVEMQGFLTRKVALGFQPAFAKSSTTAGDSMFTLGFMFTLNYYSEGDYRGFWVQGGSGLYIISNKVSNFSTSTNAPVLQATVGWREQWALGLNIGIGVGARYIAFPEVTVTELQFKTFQPTIAVDIGFNY